MLELASEGLRIFRRNLRIKMRGSAGLQRHLGTDTQICRQIVESCYNRKKNFFMVSNGHFRQFYMRDFGLCVEALLFLGYKQEVHRTLQYALSCYSRHDKITTQITPQDIPVDSFAFSCDSLAFLLRSLRIAKANDLVEVYKPFLEQKAFEYKSRVLDRKTGLVRQGIYFSSMKDGFRRNSSCYDNCCVASVSDELTNLGLKNPFRKHDKAVMTYWNKSYFYDDISKDKYVAGDANSFPFYFGVVKDKDVLKKAVKSIRGEGLDDPLPLRYSKDKRGGKRIWINRVLVPNYEGNTIWAHLGMAYICVIAKYDKEMLSKYLDSYKKHMIDRYRNFLEVLNSDLTPYSSAFYYCDENMVWASIYLWLKQMAKS